MEDRATGRGSARPDVREIVRGAARTIGEPGMACGGARTDVRDIIREAARGIVRGAARTIEEPAAAHGAARTIEEPAAAHGAARTIEDPTAAHGGARPDVHDIAIGQGVIRPVTYAAGNTLGVSGMNPRRGNCRSPWIDQETFHFCVRDLRCALKEARLNNMDNRSWRPPRPKKRLNVWTSRVPTAG
ncbi:uncharacterized protein LOC143372260 [Andrena cerasifolii]|uniref:uncharacterized protein LOC143372260 n=1 Tax=Andrena cerasifolii TaxID=2819439 RepID=UPI004037B0D5